MFGHISPVSKNFSKYFVLNFISWVTKQVEILHLLVIYISPEPTNWDGGGEKSYVHSGKGCGEDFRRRNISEKFPVSNSKPYLRA